jgi:hypothetical protein
MTASGRKHPTTRGPGPQQRSLSPLPDGHARPAASPGTTHSVLIFPVTPSTTHAFTAAAPIPTAQRVGEVLIGAAEGFAAVALEGAALALHTVAAVVWPVQTAAEVMTRAMCGAGGVGELGPWLPAGVPTVPVEPDLPIEQSGRGAVRRHLTAVPRPRPGPPAGVTVVGGSGD